MGSKLTRRHSILSESDVMADVSCVLPASRSYVAHAARDARCATACNRKQASTQAHDVAVLVSTLPSTHQRRDAGQEVDPDADEFFEPPGGDGGDGGRDDGGGGGGAMMPRVVIGADGRVIIDQSSLQVRCCP